MRATSGYAVRYFGSKKRRCVSQSLKWHFGAFRGYNAQIAGSPVSLRLAEADLMVGQQPLKLFIGVRVPGRQQSSLVRKDLRGC